MTRRDALALVAIAAGLVLVAVSALSWWRSVDSAGSAQGPRFGERTLSAGPATAGVQRLRQLPQRHYRLRPSEPTAISIPALGVSTAVSPISSGQTGVLTPPSDFTTVGWWADGPQPGARRGTVIIAGHTVHTGGGAFDHLDRMSSGERVVVVRGRRDLVYRVSSVTVYRKGTLAARAGTVFSQRVPGRLALVTCDDWNGQEYLSNVVVIAASPRPVLTRVSPSAAR